MSVFRNTFMKSTTFDEIFKIIRHKFPIERYPKFSHQSDAFLAFFSSLNGWSSKISRYLCFFERFKEVFDCLLTFTNSVNLIIILHDFTNTGTSKILLKLQICGHFGLTAQQWWRKCPGKHKIFRHLS